MRDVVELPEELLESLRQLGEQYGHRPGSRFPIKPPVGAVEQRILAFGIVDAATVASLILGVWGILYPPDARSKCTFSGQLPGKRCGAPILHTEYDRTNRELVMVCAAHHQIVQRKPRVYR